MTVTWPEGDVLGRTGAAWEALLTRGVNVCEFGAIGDARQVSDAAMSSGGSTVTSATLNATTADVGKAITIQDAISSTASLVTTITGVLSSTQVTVATPAAVAVSSKQAMIGTKNNTPFSQAVTYAGAATVYVPAGTYLFQGAAFFTTANQTIIGARGATLLADGSAVRPFQFSGDGHTFDGLTFDHNWVAHSNPTDPAHATLFGVTTGTRDWLTVRNCTIKNSPLYGVQAQNQSHLRIQDCYFENIGTQAINVGATSSYTDFLIENNSIDNTMVDGTLPALAGGPNGSGISAGGAKNIRILGNTVLCPPATTPSLHANSQGIIGAIVDGVISANVVQGSRIAYSPAGPTSTCIAFTGNVAIGPLDYAFEFPDVSNVTITGNLCDGAGVTGLGVLLDGGGVVKDGAHVTVTGNTIINMTTAGGTAIGTQNFANHHLVISNNVIEITTGEGIYLKSAGTVYVSIMGNTINNLGTAVSGVRLENCDDVVVMGNMLVGSFTNPINLTESSPVTRTRLTIIGNISDKATTVVKSANLTYGAGCRVHSNSADTAATTI